MFVYCVVCRCVYGTRPWAIGILMDTIDKPDSTGLDETRVD